MTKLVIFDCDGVLVDSEPITNTLLIEDLAQYGLTITWEQVESLFIGGTMAGVHKTARAMGADLPDTWVDEIYVKVYDRLKAGVPLIPGVPELLDHLDEKGVQYCVASNGSLEKMEITLGQNGLWDRFEGRRFSAHTEGVAKPDPGLFLAAADRCGVAPDHAMVIEDSRNGVLAAQRAGIRCLAFLPSGEGTDFEALGAHVIRAMSEATAHLTLSRIA